MRPTGACLFAAALLASLSLGRGDSGATFAMVMWRHGDRSPTECFPTTEAQCAKRWPEGFGMLTPEGMRLGYDLGKALRQRYAGSLIDTNYSRTQIHVRSTDFDRTLQTAQSVMQGLFPAGSGPVTKEGDPGLTKARLQPVPEHTVSQDLDTLLLAYSSATCPAMAGAGAAERRENAAEWAEVEARWDAIRPAVKAATGLPDDRLTIGAMFAVWDVAVCDMAHGYALPPGLEGNATLLGALEAVADFTLAHLFASRQQQRLSAGRLVAELTARLTAAVAGDVQPGWDPTTFPEPDRAQPAVALGPRLWGYSAHDATIVSLLQALRAYDGVHPPYASSVAVELVPVPGAAARVRGADRAGAFAVRAFYNTNQTTGNGAFGPAQRLSLPCASRPASAALRSVGAIGEGSCTVADFAATYADVSMPGDVWEEACDGRGPSPSPAAAAWTAEQEGAVAGAGAGGLVVGGLAAGLGAWACGAFRRRRGSEDGLLR